MKAQMFKANEVYLKKFWFRQLEKGENLTNEDFNTIRSTSFHKQLINQRRVNNESYRVCKR